MVILAFANSHEDFSTVLYVEITCEDNLLTSADEKYRVVHTGHLCSEVSVIFHTSECNSRSRF